MRLGWFLVILSVGCGASSTRPVPSSPSPAAPTKVPTAGASKPIICEGVKTPYPLWDVSEQARRDAAAPFTTAVGTGNQRRLPNESLKPWVAFLNATHQRLHPIFTDTYLASLCSLDRRDALNDPALSVKLDITVLPDGSMEKVGVVEASGQPTFDAAAVESFQRLATLPRPDPSMLSEDGRAHLHWQFSRDETRGCSTMRTRPFNLGAPPVSK